MHYVINRELVEYLLTSKSKLNRRCRDVDVEGEVDVDLKELAKDVAKEGGEVELSDRSVKKSR